MKNNLKIVYGVFYVIFCLGICFLLVLQVLNKVPLFNQESIFLILIISALILIPMFDKFKIKDVVEIQKSSIKDYRSLRKRK